MRRSYYIADKWKFATLLIAVSIMCTTRYALSADDTGFYSELQPLPAIAPLTELGRALFFDAALSASGKVACASCHDPSRAYGPPRETVLPMLNRATPSLRYLCSVPPFTEHFHDSDGDDSEDQGPVGGRTWDGRAQSAHDQARLPLLSPQEMANRNEMQVIMSVRNGKHAAGFRELFGVDIFTRPTRAFKAVLLSLEVFQQSPADFCSYSSKYDAYLRGQAQLSVQEARGLQLFNDVDKGNCASCHPSGIKQGAFPLFTDFGFIALGIPRNRKLPGNTSENFYDEGLCGPERTDLAAHAEYCGLFRVPSLRNVALRSSFFHNGAITQLADAVRFYAQRDSQPQKWYPRNAAGLVQKFDDLPQQYHVNINRDPPFGSDASPLPEPLSEQEVDDIVAFLRTLTDSDIDHK